MPLFDWTADRSLRKAIVYAGGKLISVNWVDTDKDTYQEYYAASDGNIIKTNRHGKVLIIWIEPGDPQPTQVEEAEIMPKGI